MFPVNLLKVDLEQRMRVFLLPCHQKGVSSHGRATEVGSEHERTRFVNGNDIILYWLLTFVPASLILFENTTSTLHQKLAQ